AAERRRLEEELKLARQIQVALLPSQLPEVEGYEIWGGNVPSRGVSGDYFKIEERLEGSELVFVIADVSGKGIAASLLTASLEALAAGPIEVGQDPAEICTKVGRRLYQRTPPAKYATMILAILDPETGKLRYTNGGHNPALVIRTSGEHEQLKPTGMPVGLMPEAQYTQDSVELGPGDLLILYTDGITEAANPEDDEYGIERLAEICKQNREATLDDLAAAIEQNLDDFVQGVPYADDRTFVLTRRRSS
ncbi:MAG: SpoIIE family protein phosphatase, partial [Nitrospirae bacterium]|nr:SpoIIE family protein phosphatase [Nitrospirota bacterium]